jgi:hypothetical protein
VAPREHTDGERRYYELHIAETGEVETRPENAHDFFNALAWIAYPRAKAMINAQHAAIPPGARQRKRRSGAAPNATRSHLFDEGGVAVLFQLGGTHPPHRGFRVEGTLLATASELMAKMRFLAFGHASTRGRSSPTRHGRETVFIRVDDDFLAIPDAVQRERVDHLLAAHFSHRAKLPIAKEDGADARAGRAGMASGYRAASPSTTMRSISGERHRSLRMPPCGPK